MAGVGGGMNLTSHLLQRALKLDPPTAYRFKRGHRTRVQVSSGAFPRYARNPGTGEPHATAARLLAATQTVYHDPARPSAIILPVRQGP